MEIAYLLIEHGADIYAEDCDDRNVLGYVSLEDKEKLKIPKYSICLIQN